MIKELQKKRTKLQLIINPTKHFENGISPILLLKNQPLSPGKMISVLHYQTSTVK